jgi:hypothetical protein
MNTNNQSRCLEYFPDEIFLYGIFPLFSWEELYHTFLGLNQRFNDILRSLKHLDFIVNATNNHHLALHFFAPCIVRLTVCLGQFDIKPFIGLRSLTLQYPSLQQRNSIRPENFSFLEYLNLSYPLEDSILLNLIFSNAFEYLKECKFDRTLTNHIWNSSPKLRSLSISVNNSYGIICVLRACPNISRLNIIVYDIPEDSTSLPRHSISCMNLFLRRLFIRSNFAIVAAILTLTPNLKWFTFEDITINLGRGSPGFNFKFLADILSKLRLLSYLHFTIETSDWDRHTSLQTLHPLFRHVKNGRSNTIVIVSSSPTDNE